MKKYLFFTFILFGFSAFFSFNVFALDFQYWGQDMEYHLMNAHVLNASGQEHGVVRSLPEYYTSYLWATVDSRTVYINNFVPDLMKSDYLYSITTYVCFTNVFPTSFKTYAIRDERQYSNFETPSFEATSVYWLNPQNALPVNPNSSTDYGSCRAITSLIVPTFGTAWYSIKLSVPSGQIGISLFGFDVDEVGIWDGRIQQLLSTLNNNVQSVIENDNRNKEEIINNQNSNTQKQISNANENTDKLLNADAQSSFKGDGGSTSNYEESEKNLMESIDVDVDDVDMDLSPFLNPFKWIWEQVDKVLNLNSKIFSTVITVLTFGFIGLVINRG